jgi:hypothetical protein
MGSADRSPTARPCQPATVFDFPRPLARGRAHALTEGKCWRFYALVDPLDQALSRPSSTAMRVIEGWRKEAIKANREIERVVLAYEVGRDGSLGAPRDSSLVPMEIGFE